MIKSIVTVLAGAAAALESERLTARFKERFRASTLTDALLGKLNRHLEESRESSEGTGARSPEPPA